MSIANAKEIKLPRGILSAAAEKLGYSRQWVGEAWRKEVPEVVDTVHVLVKAWADAEKQKKDKLEKIETIIQTI